MTTISCATGCGKQVGYTQYPFSDGFVYILYIDSDGQPHHCKNLVDDYFDDWPNSFDSNGNEIISNNYGEFFLGLLHIHFASEAQIEEGFKLFQPSQIQTKALDIFFEQTKSVCNILPMPFFKTDSERDETVYNLTILSECYFQQGRFDDALLALTIQNGITNDQIKHITNLQNKQHETTITNEKISVNVLKNKVQRIEFLIKDYLRTFPIKIIFEFNEEKRYQIEKNLKNQILLDNAKERDEIDGLTLGDCISILYYFKNVKFEKFSEWTGSHRPHLMLIQQFRNHISAHPTTENIEGELTEEEKIFYNVSCEKLLKHLEKINHK